MLSQDEAALEKKYMIVYAALCNEYSKNVTLCSLFLKNILVPEQSGSYFFCLNNKLLFPTIHISFLMHSLLVLFGGQIFAIYIISTTFSSYNSSNIDDLVGHSHSSLAYTLIPDISFLHHCLQSQFVLIQFKNS